MNDPKRERRARAWGSMKVLWSRTAGRQFTAAEQAEFDRLDNELDRMTAEIEASERHRRYAERINK